MTETELDRWAAIYRANPALERAGIDFGDLLDDPGLLWGVVGGRPPHLDDGPCPLLPAQAAVAERVRRADEIADAVRARATDRAVHLTACAAHAEDALPIGARRRGRGFVEPLSHHAHGRNSENCRMTRPLR